MSIKSSELIINGQGCIYHLGIEPQQLADLVVTVGDPRRVGRVSQHLTDIEFESSHREFSVCTGYYHQRRLTVLSTGMGTQNIDIVMNELDALVNIDFTTRTVNDSLRQLSIIRLGTSGALQADIDLGSIIVSTHAIDLTGTLHYYPNCQRAHEIALSEAFSDAMSGNLPGGSLAFSADDSLCQAMLKPHESQAGITVTCDGFYAPQGRALRVKPHYPDFINRLADFESEGARVSNFEMETAGIYGLGRVLNHRCCSLNMIAANRRLGQFVDSVAPYEDKLIQFFFKQLANSEI